jgi:hypothetical protein
MIAELEAGCVPRVQPRGKAGGKGAAGRAEKCRHRAALFQDQHHGTTPVTASMPTRFREFT